MRSGLHAFGLYSPECTAVDLMYSLFLCFAQSVQGRELYICAHLLVIVGGYGELWFSCTLFPHRGVG